MASYLPPIKILFGLVMQTPHHPPPPPQTSATAKGTFLTLVCLCLDHGCRVWSQRSLQETSTDTSMTLQQ